MNKQLLSFFFLAVVLGAISTYLILSQTTKKIASQPVTTSITKPSSHFSLESAPSESLQGTILSYTGEVKWQSRTATQSAILTQVVPIQQGESLETGKDGKISLAFQGSCQLTLFPKTTIYIYQTLPSTILINQSTGSVDYTANCQTPMSVRSDRLLVFKKTGEMKVVVDTDNSLITVTNLTGSASAGFNDANSMTTVDQIAENTSYQFDDDALVGKSRPLKGK